jgi:hypothetical protein
MNSTYATVVIEAEYQAAAQADMGEGFFVAGFSADGSAPATSYISSGWFLNSELDFIVNDATWPKQVFFGNDLQSVLTQLNLVPVIEPEQVEEADGQDA